MKSRLLAFVISFTLAISPVPTANAAPSLSGKILDSSNNPIAGVKVNLLQSGAQVASFATGSDGNYLFNVNAGAYSLQLVPPNSGYSKLNALDILIPAPQPINFSLTPPTPGRAFLSGHVTTPVGFELDNTGTSISFASSASLLQDNLGTFRLMPTAGIVSTFSVSGKMKSDPVNFKLIGKTNYALNQDTMAEIRLPLYRQRIRVVTANGSPISGATLYGGVSMDGKSNQVLNPIEGLGNFEGSWYAQWITTDANGWANIPAIAFANSAIAKFDVTIPSNYQLASQSFSVVVGSGDQTLIVNKPLPALSGVVKDLNGKPLKGVVVKALLSSGGGGSTTDSNGRYKLSMVANDNYSLSMEIPNDSVIPNFYMSSWANSANFAFKSDSNLDLTVPLNTTKVKVLDANGLPAKNVFVSIKPKSSATTQYTAPWTLIPGKAALNTYFYSTGYTDSQGYVTLPTLKLDKEVDGEIYSDNNIRPDLNWVLSVQKIGFGKDLTIQLVSPTISLSGSSKYSDGSVASISFSVSKESAKAGSVAQIAQTTNGNFTGKATRAMTGQWTFGCGRVDVTLQSDFCPSVSGGPIINLDKDLVQDFVVPVYKTRIQVVDAEGKGISNVKALINTSMKASNTLTLLSGKTPFYASFISVGTTDANGFADLTSLKMDNAQKAYLELTPDPNSRYQTTGLTITVGDNSKNVIVMQIPKPEISGIAITTVNGVKTATITGNNFIGVFSVKVGAYSFDDFTNKNGALTTQGFKILDKTHISFPVPAGLTSAAVTITNGGGSITSATVKFN